MKKLWANIKSTPFLIWLVLILAFWWLIKYGVQGFNFFKKKSSDKITIRPMNTKKNLKRAKEIEKHISKYSSLLKELYQ